MKKYLKKIYVSIEAGFIGLISFVFGYKTAFFIDGAPPIFGGLWSMASGLVVLFAFVDSSIESAKVRVISSMIGALAAVLFSSLLGANYLSMFLAVSITVLTSLLFGYEKGSRISSCVAAMVIGIGALEPKYHPFNSAILRLTESLFGILIALFAVLFSYKVKVRKYTNNKKVNPRL